MCVRLVAVQPYPHTPHSLPSFALSIALSSAHQIQRADYCLLLLLFVLPSLPSSLPPSLLLIIPSSHFLPLLLLLNTHPTLPPSLHHHHTTLLPSTPSTRRRSSSSSSSSSRRGGKQRGKRLGRQVLLQRMTGRIPQHPRVGRNLIQGQATRRLLNQQLGNQVLGFRRDLRGETEVDPTDPSIGGLMPLRFKRRIAHQELVHQHPQAPDIHPLIVLLPLNHLRGQVVQGPTQRLSARRRRVDRPPKISNLQLTLRAQQQVLWLDVTVDDVLLVAVPEGGRHLEDELGGLAFGEAALVGQMLVELAVGGILQNEVDALVIVEVAVHSQDVLVAEVSLDFNLQGGGRGGRKGGRAGG